MRLIFMLVPFFIVAALIFYMGRRLFQWLQAMFPRIRGRIFWPMFAVLMTALFTGLPLSYANNWNSVKIAVWAAAGFFMFLLMALVAVDVVRLGFFVARRKPRILSTAKAITVTVDKPADGRESLNIVVAGDQHIGSVITAGRLRAMVERIHAENPDIVVLSGDLFDGEYSFLSNTGEIVEIFRELSAPLGVYAVTGNHEARSEYDGLISFFEQTGITLLKDETVEVAGVTLVGRLDQAVDFAGVRRAGLASYASQVDFTRPVVVLDHRPDAYRENADFGADLMISGHTHGGQYWPLSLMSRGNYITEHGRVSVEDMELIVTSGVGTGNIPIRLGSTAEIVRVTLEFAGT